MTKRRSRGGRAIKPLPYEAILSLEEAIIREFFPKGVIQVGKGDRWQPAEKKADRTLARLLRDKRDRRERPRYLAASSAHRLRYDKKLKKWVLAGSHPDQDRGYTDTPYGAMMPDTGEAVDEETQKRFSKEAQDRHDQIRGEDKLRDDLRSYIARLRQVAIAQIREGRDPTPVFQRAMSELSDEREAA